MTRWLLLVLALVLPLQLSWAAVADYGHAAPAAASQHADHHGDEHSGHDANASATACVDHAGCHCHAHHTPLLPPAALLADVGSALTPSGPPRAAPPSAPAERPERPNWAALA